MRSTTTTAVAVLLVIASGPGSGDETAQPASAALVIAPTTNDGLRMNACRVDGSAKPRKPEKRMKLLVVAAWEPELERFRELAREPLITHIAAGVGIGLVDAAIGTAGLLAEHAPDSVLLLGTCGSAPGSSLAIGDIVVARSVLLVDPATAEGRAALPWSPAPIEGAEVAAFVAAGAIAARVATTLGITTDDALAATLARDAETEHLEAYAVARACAVRGIPCTVLLGITNVVGSTGRAAWRANHVAVSAKVADLAVRALARTSTRAQSRA